MAYSVAAVVPPWCVGSPDMLKRFWWDLLIGEEVMWVSDAEVGVVRREKKMIVSASDALYRVNYRMVTGSDKM